jgi:hypothetical protein
MEPLTVAQPNRNLSGMPGGTLRDVPKGGSVIFSVRMPEDLHEELRRFAQSDDSTVNRSIIVAVRRYLRQMKARQPKGGEDAR